MKYSHYKKGAMGFIILFFVLLLITQIMVIPFLTNQFKLSRHLLNDDYVTLSTKDFTIGLECSDDNFSFPLTASVNDKIPVSTSIKLLEAPVAYGKKINDSWYDLSYLNDPSRSEQLFPNNTPQFNDSALIGGAEKFSLIRFDIDTVGSNINFIVQYSDNGINWKNASGLIDKTAGFSQNGSISFAASNDWKKVEFYGSNAYWIRFTIIKSGGISPNITQAWLDSISENALFDREIPIEYGKKNNGTWTDLNYLNNPSQNEQLFPNNTQINDSVIIGGAEKFSRIRFKLNSPSINLTYIVQYSYNSTHWFNVSHLNDETSNLTKDGRISFAMPIDWQMVEFNGSSAYWIRFESTVINGTPPNVTQAWLDSFRNFTHIHLQLQFTRIAWVFSYPMTVTHTIGSRFLSNPTINDTYTLDATWTATGFVGGISYQVKIFLVSGSQYEHVSTVVANNSAIVFQGDASIYLVVSFSIMFGILIFGIVTLFLMRSPKEQEESKHSKNQSDQ